MNMQTEDPELHWLAQENKHQLTDLVFFDEELRFLRSLLHKFFPTMLQDAHLNKVQLISNRLDELGMVKANVTRDMLIHQGNLHFEISKIAVKSIDFLKLEHERMETEIRDLNKCFKSIKKDIFTIYKNLHIDEGV